jgi:hypothetical protein
MSTKHWCHQKINNCPFWYFLSQGSELDLKLGSQSSTEKATYFGQWQNITKIYPDNAISLLI